MTSGTQEFSCLARRRISVAFPQCRCCWALGGAFARAWETWCRRDRGVFPDRAAPASTRKEARHKDDYYPSNCFAGSLASLTGACDSSVGERWVRMGAVQLTGRRSDISSSAPCRLVLCFCCLQRSRFLCLSLKYIAMPTAVSNKSNSICGVAGPAHLKDGLKHVTRSGCMVLFDGYPTHFAQSLGLARLSGQECVDQCLDAARAPRNVQVSQGSNILRILQMRATKCCQYLSERLLVDCTWKPVRMCGDAACMGKEPLASTLRSGTDEVAVRTQPRRNGRKRSNEWSKQ